MSRDDLLDRAAAAALALAADRPWPGITLRDLALKAGVPFAQLYEAAPVKAAVLAHLSRRFDLAALSGVGGESEVVDRLFDACMARLEAMEPHRAALIAIGRAEGPLRLAPRLARTAHALLTAAGLEPTPPRLAAMTAVWARLLQVWRDDTGALNRTMAEADKRLRQMRAALGRIGARF